MKKLLILSFALMLLTAGCVNLGSGDSAKALSMEEAKAKTIDFINNNLVQPGSEVSIKEATEEFGMYKMVINMSTGQEIVSYLTKDGTKFFPQVMDIAEIEGQNQANNTDQEAAAAQPAANVPKAEKANVELFVMSHCPYGTQIEKGILPVLETLGDQVDFELKFCDYAMHGEKELAEQLNQYCIQKNEPDKFIQYLTCFLDNSDGEACLAQTGINISQLNSCVATTDQEYKVMENFENQAEFRGSYPSFYIYKDEVANYGVSGSPTLVINGQKIQSGRDSASLLTNICSGYDNPPAECDTVLSSAAPAPGFGFDGTGSNTTADCGS